MSRGEKTWADVGPGHWVTRGRKKMKVTSRYVWPDGSLEISGVSRAGIKETSHTFRVRPSWPVVIHNWEELSGG